jgi:photosystem II 13kDa protein
VPRCHRTTRTNRAVSVVCERQKACLQFVKGVNETCIPDVKLTRSRTGVSGTARFTFDNPDVFNATTAMGEITGLYMIDDEGVLSTVDVNAKFVNGKPKVVEAQYVMRSAFEWDRFMRFMDRFAADNGLGFSKAGA